MRALDPGALAAVDQWLAAVREVDRLADRYPFLMEDARTAEVVRQLHSGSWRALARLKEPSLPSGMGGQILVSWTTGELQFLASGGCRLPEDVTRPVRVGAPGDCARCEVHGYLSAAFVAPAPPTLIGLCVCIKCESELVAFFGTGGVPWIVKESE